MHMPRVIVGGSDMMSPEARELIEVVYGVPLLSHYNATEAFQIGFLCEARRDFHLQTDLCHVLVVSSDGEKAAPGEQGEVVITNLVNRGTVLLNYRIGDLATRSDAGCSCGRTFPLLSRLEGRVDDIVYLESGNVRHPFLVWGVIKEYPGIARYQLIQREQARFILLVVTDDRAGFDRVAEGLARDLSRLLEGAKVEVEYREALEAEPHGKFRAVVALGKAEPPVPSY